MPRATKPTSGKPELVIAIVCPLGTNYLRPCHWLERSLKEFGYRTNVVRISAYFPRLLSRDPEARRRKLGAVTGKIWAGDRIRKLAKDPAVLAKLAVAAIGGVRNGRGPQANTCHLIVQLKRPEEAILLRRVYGPSFYLLGLFPDKEEQNKFFKTFGLNQRKWVALDGNEGDRFGQRTTDTFHLADAYLSSSSRKEADRFLNLIFANPFITPTRDERGMYFAFASAFSSGDLSRQVGASLMDERGDILAVGFNEVPRPGGGPYEVGPGSARDIERGYDANHRERERIAQQAAKAAGVKQGEALRILRDTDLRHITEYGRAVHAEMDAIISCARTGRGTRGSTMFVTTFPCHNCARHIIAAGVRRVVYVEPYPRSKALDLHNDAISIANTKPRKKPGGYPVAFEQFRGFGPRRYGDLFALRLGSGRQLAREVDGKKIHWQRIHATPRLEPVDTTYTDLEKLVKEEFDEASRGPFKLQT